VQRIVLLRADSGGQIRRIDPEAVRRQGPGASADGSAEPVFIPAYPAVGIQRSGCPGNEPGKIADPCVQGQPLVQFARRMDREAPAVKVQEFYPDALSGEGAAHISRQRPAVKPAFEEGPLEIALQGRIPCLEQAAGQIEIDESLPVWGDA
jgi:hypothetical protein